MTIHPSSCSLAFPITPIINKIAAPVNPVAIGSEMPRACVSTLPRCWSGIGWNRTGPVLATRVYLSSSSENFNSTRPINNWSTFWWLWSHAFGGNKLIRVLINPTRVNNPIPAIIAGGNMTVRNTPIRSMARPDTNHCVASSHSPNTPLN